MATEVLTPTSDAAALVSQGHAVIRIENDCMMQVAVQRPRDEGAVIKGALAELDLVPEEAAKAFYSIPYRERQPDGGYKLVKVEGPSIKAAMALARRWGNCTTGARVLNEDVEGFDLEGVFIDLETNFRVTRPLRTSKWYKPRAGGRQLLSVDRQLMAVQAGASKALRNAILAGLPAYLVSAYDKKARAIVGGKLDAPADERTRAAVLKAFERWKVTQAQLETYIELPLGEWTGTQIADLRGLWNAISDGQTTVEEAFGGAKDEPQAGPSVATVTPETLLSGTATGQDNAPPTNGAPTTPVPASPGPDVDAERTTLLTLLVELQPKAGVAAPEWAALCRQKAGVEPEGLATADVAALQDLVAEVQGRLKAQKQRGRA